MTLDYTVLTNPEVIQNLGSIVLATDSCLFLETDGNDRDDQFGAFKVDAEFTVLDRLEMHIDFGDGR
jgi:hypothetical protein